MKKSNTTAEWFAHGNIGKFAKGIQVIREKETIPSTKIIVLLCLCFPLVFIGKGFGQCITQPLINYDFNSTLTPAINPAAGLSSSVATSQANSFTSSANGVATGVGSFFTNAQNPAVQVAFPLAGGNVNIDFTITGATISKYKTFEIYFQERRVAALGGNYTATIFYNRDNAGFVSFGTATITTSYTAVTLTLPAAANNPSTSLIIRIQANQSSLNNSASRVDNFQVRALPDPTAPSTFLNASICSGATATISATPVGTSTITWFSAPAGGSSIGAGNSFSPSTGQGIPPYDNTVSGTYTFYAESNLFTCVSPTRTPVTVTVGPLLTLSPVATPATICDGSNSSLNANILTGSPTFSYSWSPSTFLSSTTSATPTIINATATTTYTVNVTDACGNTNSGSVTLTVNQLPGITINPVPSSATICTSGSVSLTANGANTYTWAPSTGLNATAGTTVIASPVATTVYTVTGTSVAGCTSTQTITVFYSLPITVAALATPSNTCFGGTSQLQAFAGNTSNYSVAANTLSPVSTAGLTAGSYTNMPTGDDVLSNSVPVGFNFSFFGNTYSTFVISTNGNIQFGNPPTSIAWTPRTIPHSLTPIAAGNGNGINNYIALAWRDWTTVGNGEINYYTTGTAPDRICIIDFNDVGNYVGQIILHESTNIFDIITTNIGNNTSVQGIEDFTGATGVPVPGRNNVSWSSTSATSYTFTPSGGLLTYSWFPPTFLSASNISNPVVQNITSATTYTVTASDINGCSSTNSVAVTINPLSLSCSSSPAGFACQGSTVNLQSISTGGKIPYSYSWSNGAITQSTSITASTPQTYTVTVTDACGSTQSCEVFVDINPLPAITINSNPSPAVICTSGSVLLNANGANTYAWTPSTGLSATTGNSVTASPPGSTTYIVTGTNSFGCTSSQSVAVNVSPAINILSATATPTNPCFNASSQLNASASNTNSYNVTSVPFGFAASTSPTTVSLGNDAISGAITLPFNFSFYGNNFTQIFIGSNGFIQFGVSSGSTGIYGQTLPSAANPNNILAGAWTDLNPSGGGTVTYFTSGGAPNRIFCVRFNNVQIPGILLGNGSATFQMQLLENGNKIEVHLQSISQPIIPNGGQTTLGIKNNNGSLFTAPAGRFNNGNWGATNEAWRFTPSAGSYNYSWSPPTFLTATNISNPVAQNITSTTTYIVNASDVNGCSATSSVTVTIIPVAVNCSVSPSGTACFGSAVTLQSSPSGGSTPYTYLWSSGGTTQNTTITASSSQSYTVTVTDACGNTEACAVAVNVNPAPPVAVTSIPSPAVICTSGSVELTANGAVSYNWSPSSGLSATTGDSVAASPLLTTAYTVIGTGSNGCTASQTIVVNYSTPITLSATATPSLICINSNSQLAATAFNNYTVQSIPFGLTTAVSPTSVTLGDDAMSGAILLPFTFTFYGVNYNQLFISSNGFVQLGTSSGSTNVYGQTLPSAANPNSIIAGAWADLDPGSGGTVRYWTSGITPNRIFTVSFTSVPFFDQLFGSNGNATFQIQIKEAGNVAEVHLQTVTTSIIPSAGATTLAIKSSSGNQFVAPPGRFNNGHWNVSTPEAWRFVPPTPIGFSWSPSTFLSSTTISNPIVQNVTTSTIYTVTATDGNGCSTTNSVSVTVRSPVTCNTPIISGSICQNSPYTITSQPSSGLAPYTYIWSTGASTSSITDSKAAGNYTYTVTVTDNCGTTCSSNATVSINLFKPFLAEGDSVLCSNDAGFDMHVLDSGVFAGVYPPGTTFDFYGAGAILYQSGASNIFFNANNSDAFYAVVTLPGYLGNCSSMSDTAVIDFGSAQAPQYTLTTDSVKCYGDASGKAIAQIMFGGTSGFRWQWYNSSGLLVRDVTDTAQVDTLSDVPAGMYTLLLTDHQGSLTTPYCSITDSIFIGQAATSLSATENMLNHVNNLCHGDSTGVIDIAISGGTIPYTYNWGNGAITEDISGLVAGVYNCTVTDSRGCSTAINFTVTEPQALVINPIVTDVLCNGGTGSVVVNVTGGVLPYSYNWSNGSNSQSTTGLASGTYTVTVTDSNGCALSSSYTVNEPAVLLANCTSSNNSCYNSNNGTVNVVVTGGTASYSYLWSNGSVSSSQNSLSKGFYTVTVTDAHGCSASCSTTITQPTVLTIATLPFNPSSALPNSGAINVNATGGTSGYSYLWNNGSTLQNRTGLAAGTYTVTVTDANGCTSSSIVALTINCVLSFTNQVIQQPSCGKNNGIATVIPSGGTSYSFAWQTTPVQTTATATGLSYYYNSLVLISDVSGCSRWDTVVLPTSNGLVLTLASPVFAGGYNIRCNGGNTGSINLTVGGSTGPYSYLWNNGVTTQNLTGLSAGTYVVTVSNGGCTNMNLITLTQPSVLVANVTKVNPTCFGSSNGSATVIAGGGVAPYTYSWNTSPVKTSATASGLPAGNYIVTVSDANGCTKTALTSLTQPTAMSITGITTNANCNGGTNGSIDITISGGTPPYNYLWTGGATTQDRINVLPAGTYTATVTDSKGCTIQYSGSVTQPIAITASSTSTNVSCFGGANGTGNVIASGGTPPYTYSWNSVPVKTGASVTGLKKGIYTVIITDSHGCLKGINVNITEPTAINISIAKVNVSVPGGNNGSATANVSGGVSPYSYSWNTVPVKTSQTASGLIAGTYTVTVTDANVCTKTASVVITQPSPRMAGDIQNNTVSNSVVYPNPSAGKFTVSFDETIRTIVSLKIYSLTGERVFTKDIRVSENESSFDMDLSELPRGLYLIHYNTKDKGWIEKISIE